MSDITIAILKNSPTHVIGEVAKNSSRYTSGDIIEIFPAKKYAVLVGNEYQMHSQKGNSKILWMHVTGVPITIKLDKLKSVLSSPVPDPLDISGINYLRRRKWGIPINNFPLLISQGEITLTWAQFLGTAYRKSPLDNYSPDTDEHITDMTLATFN